jgi:hypothetical protein
MNAARKSITAIFLVVLYIENRDIVGEFIVPAAAPSPRRD